MTADAIVPLESGRALTAAAFQGLAAVPAEAEWFANLGNAFTRVGPTRTPCRTSSGSSASPGRRSFAPRLGWVIQRGTWRKLLQAGAGQMRTSIQDDLKPSASSNLEWTRQ